MNNVLKLILLSATMLISFNSFAGPVTDAACSNQGAACSSNNDTGVHVGAAGVANKESKSD